MLVAVGGALGALARYGLGGWVQGGRTDFPLGTLLVNLLGCFVMGFVMHWTSRGYISSELRFFLAIGILGGFTTFSSFSMESLRLFEEGRVTPALLYIGLSLLGCLVTVTAGYKIAQLLWR
jgi:CrcB protein